MTVLIKLKGGAYINLSNVANLKIRQAARNLHTVVATMNDSLFTEHVLSDHKTAEDARGGLETFVDRLQEAGAQVIHVVTW